LIFTWEGRIIAGVGIFVGIMVIFYGGFYYPQEKQVKMIENQIDRENLRILQFKKKSQECEKLKQDYEELKIKIGKIEQEFPPEQGIYSFLKDMGSRARTYGITYLNISVGKISGEKYYEYIPLEVHLYTDYHHLGMLLSDLNKRKRMSSFKINKFDLRGLKEEEREGGNYTIEANLSLFLSFYQQSFIETIPKEKIVTSPTVSGGRRR